MDTHNLYSIIRNSSCRTYSELPKIIVYGESLLLIVDKCGSIYNLHTDVEQADSLTIKVTEAIAYLKKGIKCKH